MIQVLRRLPRRLRRLYRAGDPLLAAMVAAGLFGASQAPAMPSGALGIWYVDTYDSVNKAIPNSVSGTPVSTNIFRQPRRLFKNSTASPWYVNNGCTVTDLAAAAPDGRMDASTVVSTDASQLGLNRSTQGSLPAGTYAACLSYRQNGGTLNQFKMRVNSTVQVSPTYVATSVWQRAVFVVTLAAGSRNFQVVSSIDGTTGFDIQICDFQVFPGSADLNPNWATQSPLDSHIYLGRDTTDTTVSVSGGTVAFTDANRYGFLQLPDPVTVTNFATMAVAAKVNAGTGSFYGFFSKLNAATAFCAGPEDSGKPGFRIGGQTACSDRYVKSTTVPTDSAYRVHASRHLSLVADQWVDDSPFFFQTDPAVAPAATTIQDVFVGCAQQPNFYLGYRVNSLALYTSGNVPSDAAITQGVAALKARAALSGLATVRPDRYYIAGGDSITSVTATTSSYARRFSPNSSPPAFGAVTAMDGRALSDWIALEPYLAKVITANPGERRFIYSLLPGANDRGNYPVAADFVAAVAAHLDRVRAMGYKVVLCTTLPRSDSAYNVWRNAINAATASWVGVHCDARADFAGDPTIGTDAAGSNTTYFGDGLHPTPAGQIIMEPIYRAAVNSL